MEKVIPSFKVWATFPVWRSEHVQISRLSPSQLPASVPPVGASERLWGPLRACVLPAARRHLCPQHGAKRCVGDGMCAVCVNWHRDGAVAKKMLSWLELSFELKLNSSL